MQIDESYFKGEVRLGTYVPATMKRCWAAQLEVYEDVRKLCDKYGIKYYAEWGTMLGAVRHGGFIPWDDDFDLGMLRSDYNLFLSVIDELPDHYKYMNIHNTPGYGEMLTRIVNSKDIRIDDPFLEKYHNCPFAIGIDLFPSDYYPRDPELADLQKQLIHSIYSAAALWPTFDEEKKASTLNNILEVTQADIDRSGDISMQLYELAENICQIADYDSADKVGIQILNVERDGYGIDKECYQNTIEVPFEFTSVPVIAGYEKYLGLKYGDFMRVVKGGGGHDYPFYRHQRWNLDTYLEAHPEQCQTGLIRKYMEETEDERKRGIYIADRLENPESKF